MKHIFTALVLFAATTALAAEPVAIQFDGVLGQSQPEAVAPLPFVDVNGVVADKQGNLWTVSGVTLFQFTSQPDGQWIGSAKLKLPTSIFRGLRSDGERAFFLGYDWNVYAFDPQNPQPTTAVSLADVQNKNRLRFAVAPAGVKIGFAGKAKFFALDGESVRGYAADGNALGIVLTLAKPTDTSWWYCSLGVEPTSGDLLVGSYYPDIKIYRYDVAGNEVKTDGWPRASFAQGIVTLPQSAWAVQAGGSVLSLPATIVKQTDSVKIEPYWTEQASGIAIDATGGYWISCAQGLVQFDKNGQPTKRRLGGLSGVRCMSVGKEGALIIATENGQRLIRLAIDDAPDAVFASNANEPFRTGATWTSRTCGLVWDGQRFVALDEVTKQFWSFDPWHTGWGEKPWINLAKPTNFNKPTLLAQGGDRLWILDDGCLLETVFSSLNSCRVVSLLDSLSDVTALAGSADGNILCITKSHSVAAYQRSKDGTYTSAWKRSDVGQEITGAAIVNQHVLVIDKAKQSITALSLANGETETSINASAIKGGFQPTALVASERWLFVADEQGKRIIRCKVTP